MKKIYTLALLAFAGVVTANAQAFKLDKNYVIYTDHNGTDNIVNALEGAFLDDDFNTFPVSGGKVADVTHKLTKDYTDPETGVTIKAGEYKFISTATEIKFKDAYNKQGLKNIKKVIAYIGGIGSNTAYVRLTQKDEDGENYVNYEGEPETNRAWSYYCAPNLELGPKPDGDKKDDSYLTYSSPIKLTIDLTNNQTGTEEDISGHKLYVNANKSSFFQGTSNAWYCDYQELEPGKPVTEKNMFMQFYEQKKEVVDGKDKISRGDNLIAWSAENRYSVALKKGAFIMALAFICNDENAETMSINVKDGVNAKWVSGTSGITSITTDGQNVVKKGAMYNLAGQRIAAPVSGQLYIQDGKKYIKK